MELILSILGLFALGTWGFWLGILFLSVVYTIATENDIHGFAIFCTILFAGLFWNVWTALTLPWILIGVGTYLIIGGVWSVWRWFKYCREYITDNPYKSVEDYEKEDYKNGKKILLTAEEYYIQQLRPSKHKSRLIGWIAYWPWSLIWNVVGDALTAIYDALVNIYKKTAQSVIRKAMGNFSNYNEKN